jgi:hypothetical protein
MTRAERTLDLAHRVAAALRRRQLPCCVIGAAALAVHAYARATHDLDLATLVRTDRELDDLAEELRAAGLDVHVAHADAGDALGGVLSVEEAGANPVQVVNFFNPWNGWIPAGKAAIEHARPAALGELAVADVPHLVALKLYAGGRKSTLDVVELLARQPPGALAEAHAACDALGLGDALRKALAAP